MSVAHWPSIFNVSHWRLKSAIIKNNLHHALADNEFTLAYQPIIDAQTGKINGAEALLRWNNQYLGIISPEDFIPIAEEVGLIIPIGEWVIEQACTQAKQWQEMYNDNLIIAINMSTRQLGSIQFVANVEALINKVGVDPKLIELELTESAIMYDVEASIKALIELNNLGISLAIDDFGTGYSSISYLRKLKLNRLKIDKSFIKNIPIDDESTTIANAIISLAQSLNLKITAEGIETKTQLEHIKTTACDSAQGFLFSKPMDAESFEKFYSSYQPHN